MDNTGNIPDVFLDSGAPAAPCAATPLPLALLPLLPNGQQTATLNSLHEQRINEFSRISKDFHEFFEIFRNHVFSSKI